MMIIRPITSADHEGLWSIANKTGPGFTSLQPCRSAVKKTLERALLSMDSSPPKEALYLFVLEDMSVGRVVGVCGIESAVGLNAPWYNYKVSTHVHISAELGVYNSHDTLSICNDHTGYSELCSLFLDPEYRHSKNGQLLSKSRFLFLAGHPGRFSKEIIAEMRGCSNDEGVSPFWEGLGRHFFSVDFEVADQHMSKGKAFIGELMPRNPVCVNLLSDDAQEVIGKTHKNTLAARKILEGEGFRYTRYIDIFDGGPLLEAPINTIRAVRESALHHVKISNDNALEGSNTWLISNDKLSGFRCGVSAVSFQSPSTVYITKELANALQVSETERVRVVQCSHANSNSKRLDV
ncbi:MAG: arginine N-succinyltransferase [Candidatus Endonucleobacter bathymodioli]|uniref:Arginine N-succinyltransferase n=1 Tax=Candidatus Endonucleibacter bathymodioli TaxID=539814 RepID=A0AA90NNI5_9GAMM|nr:arginine N-succinyltransferase [Candidatus Endonucleobacter bathymodioli]